MLKCARNGKWFKVKDEITNLNEHIQFYAIRQFTFESVNENG